MSHVKAGGTAKNVHNNAGQRLGVKRFGGQKVKNGEVLPISNHAGGILGGISTGAPIIVRAAIKPTPSISKMQKSVNMKIYY